jgi:hypothetical protein
MDQQGERELLDLLTGRRVDLQGAPAKYADLVRQLFQLAGVLRSAAAPSDGVLDATEEAFAEFPELEPMRGARRTGAGLDASRALLIEIHNRVIKLGEQRSTKGR